MSNKIASFAFQIISLICIMITLLPQAFENYRLKTTNHLSTTTIVLLVICSEVQLVYLVWAGELPIITVSFALYTGIALFIGCQIKYYEQEQQFTHSLISKTKYYLLKKRLRFVGHYILLVLWSTMNALALYYIFELSKSHVWLHKLIGSIVPTVMEAISFFPQIILTIQTESAKGYSLIYILTDIVGMISGIISVGLEENFDIVPLISFINPLLCQLIIMILKLCVFPERSKKNDKVSPKSEMTNDVNRALEFKTDIINEKEKVKVPDLIHVSQPNGIQIPIKCDKIDETKQLSSVEHQNVRDKQEFMIDDELKNMFQNEMHAYHVTSDQSDQSVARHFINQMNNHDDPFYIVDVSHSAKQYVKWKHYLPNVKPFYSVKTNGNHFIIKIIEKMGGGFDCASIKEPKTVLSVCPNIDCSKRIIYAHPCKSISHIKYFKARNVELTVADNENELVKIKKYWPNAKILIRLKTNDSKSLIPLSTKFGANKQVSIRLLKVAKDLNLEMIGCAFHVGTGCYDKHAFKHSLEFAKEIFDLAKQPEYDFNFNVLDIGGDFPGIDEDGKPSFEEITTVIKETIKEFFPNNQEVEIIAEPGRYFAAASMDVVTSIISARYNNKDYIDHSSMEENRSLVRNEDESVENFYYISEGIYGALSNILYEKIIYSVSSLPKEKPDLLGCKEKQYKSAVFGPTYDSFDCLTMSVDLPRLDIGGHLLIYHVGAYSNSCSTKFNGFQTNQYFYIWKD